MQLVYVDVDLVVLDKPAGQLSVPGRGADKQDCLSTRVQAIYPDALIVHRLDMATSGLILMARGVAMQRVLSAAFAARQVTKRYEAVVDGMLSDYGDDWQLIDLPIGADWPNRPRRVVDHTLGKPSITRWRYLGPGPHPDTSRVQLEPVTGRTHQLRVHLLAIGHPIVGDCLYAPAAIANLSPRLMLHACALSLVHPQSGETMDWHSAPKIPW